VLLIGEDRHVAFGSGLELLKSFGTVAFIFTLLSCVDVLIIYLV
jgi:hypothetical protein